MFDLRFSDQGQGEPVVLLPPFPFDRNVWSPNIPAIVEAGHRAIAVDYPGFGDSPPASPAVFSIAAIADATAALLDKLGLKTATLMGLSMGGYVALAFAQRHPARLRALILADTRAAADSDVARQGRAQALDTLATRGVDAYLAGSLPKQLVPDAPVELLNVVTRLAVKRPAALATAIAALRDRPDRSAEAPHIACPTL
ncbi:MAG TPA: alpha/beta fold hydrolase, partial [Polyangia bacterium]|nr:alpha/beta fold hydrolase [Polyangia bacterium]